MNKIQKNYAVAKALFETFKGEMEKEEREYIAEHKITNPNGEAPDYIWCIDDKNVFNKANKEFAANIEKSGLWQKFLDTENLLKKSENALIEYGLSLMPETERRMLAITAKKNSTVREKIINLVFRLDVSTVKQKEISLG